MLRIFALIFCYVFKGQSYTALQKLEKFIDTIYDDEKIIDDLNKITKQGIMKEENPRIEEIAKEIF